MDREAQCHDARAVRSQGLITSQLAAKMTMPETPSPWVIGGVRRFVRTRLRNRIPVNREIFREFRVSGGSTCSKDTRRAKREAISESERRESGLIRTGNLTGKEQGTIRERNRRLHARGIGGAGMYVAPRSQLAGPTEPSRRSVCCILRIRRLFACPRDDSVRSHEQSTCTESGFRPRSRLGRCAE